jgi:hypothetical protein
VRVSRGLIFLLATLGCVGGCGDFASSTAVQPITAKASSFSATEWYRVQNVALGDGWSFDTGVIAQTGNYTGQYWKLSPLADGRVRLTNWFQGGGMSLDVTNSSVNLPEMAVTGDYSGQFWTLTPVGAGSSDEYRLTNEFTGAARSLEAESDHELTLGNTGATTNQYWKITAAGAAPSCENSQYATPSKDVDYRVEIASAGGDTLAFPPASQSWTVAYQYVVPPLPCSPTWNPTQQTFYDWGDVAFDTYGANGPTPLSDYVFNQIVPQIMLGNVLSGNDSAYAPSSSTHASWVMQAQYYWQHANGTSYAQTGALVSVNPGDTIITKISYDAQNGAITASISDGNDVSAIVLPRPFPNQSPAPFADWRDFFTQAQGSASSFLAEPVVNVETHYVDEATACSSLPFLLTGMALPGVASTSASYRVSSQPSLSCATSLASLDF